MPVFDDQKILKGWRPPGGGIEFGETAEDALVREFREEFDLPVETNGEPLFFENIYDHEGHTGHEIVVVFSLCITSDLAGVRSLVEGDCRYEIAWRPLMELLAPDMLFPTGLSDAIREGRLL